MQTIRSMESQHIVKQKDALSFILGGNAVFTITFRDGKRFTYKVLEDYKDKNKFKVHVLYGPDNTSNYKFFGYVEVADGVPVFESRSTYDHAKYFSLTFMNLCIGMETPGMEIYHSGRCCKCGRLLTVPESILAGIGPECAFKSSVSLNLFK